MPNKITILVWKLLVWLFVRKIVRRLEMKRNNSQYDYGLLGIIILFMVISCISIYSAQTSLPYSSNFALRQFIWYIIAFSLTAVIYYFDTEQIKRLSFPAYVFGILLLVILFLSPSTIAPEIKGIKAWFSTPLGSLQPSEFMKVFLIMFLAKLSVDHNRKFIHRTLYTDSLLIGKIVLATMIPLVLILLQPDAGTGMVILTIMIGIIFCSGVSWKILSLLTGLAVLSLGILTYIYLYQPDLLLVFLDQYQVNRIHSWLNPFMYSSNIGYQLTQSIFAIGSGMTEGKGFLNGVVDVPEAHSDFIFTTIGEEYGFIGASIVVVLYFLLLMQVKTITMKNKNEYEALIGVGVIAMFTFHIFENIGMVIGLVPITGIPLPLLSYGGSSLLSSLFALTIILNISAKSKSYMFHKG